MIKYILRLRWQIRLDLDEHSIREVGVQLLAQVLSQVGLLLSSLQRMGHRALIQTNNLLALFQENALDHIERDFARPCHESLVEKRNCVFDADKLRL